MAFETLLKIDIWVVLGAVGLYQLYLQLTVHGGKKYDEGVLRPLQYFIGIPTLGNLIVFLLEPDILTFVIIKTPMYVDVIGFFVFNFAALLIWWSHTTLGHFWSGDLEVKGDHQLIDTGPYQFVRHPLYTSYFLLTIGLFLITGNWLVACSMFLYFLIVATRTIKEEEMLLRKLGGKYAEYQSKTGRFIPTIR